MLCVSRACLAKSIVFSINLKRLPKGEKGRKRAKKAFRTEVERDEKCAPVGWLGERIEGVSLAVEEEPATKEEACSTSADRRTADPDPNQWTDDDTPIRVLDPSERVFSLILCGVPSLSWQTVRHFPRSFRWSKVLLLVLVAGRRRVGIRHTGGAFDSRTTTATVYDSRIIIQSSVCWHHSKGEARCCVMSGALQVRALPDLRSCQEHAVIVTHCRRRLRTAPAIAGGIVMDRPIVTA